MPPFWKLHLYTTKCSLLTNFALILPINCPLLLKIKYFPVWLNQLSGICIDWNQTIVQPKWEFSKLVKYDMHRYYWTRVMIIYHPIYYICLFPFDYFRLPTDVQAEAIPLILGGGDVLMAAETGSGKTGVRQFHFFLKVIVNCNGMWLCTSECWIIKKIAYYWGSCTTNQYWLSYVGLFKIIKLKKKCKDNLRLLKQVAWEFQINDI